MATASAALVDILNSLIEAEETSIFRLMGDDSPYLQEANPEVRKALQEEMEASHRHAAELADCVRRLGAEAAVSPSARPSEPMLEFISLRFLLPKLVEEKERLIRYYLNALQALPDDAPEIETSLRRHLGNHEAHLCVFRRALGQ